MPKPWTTHRGLAAPLRYANVDTDAIIPKQYLKALSRTGFGDALFDGWRTLDPGEPGQDHGLRRKNPDFILNLPRYAHASILLAGENFGCGSSREHAVWALADYGFRAVIAPSFADIFFANATKNSLLLITLEKSLVEQLMDECEATPGYALAIDLPEQSITTPSGKVYRFDIEPGRKNILVRGLDDISRTLEHAQAIRAYEEKRREEEPWVLFDEGGIQGSSCG